MRCSSVRGEQQQNVHANKISGRDAKLTLLTNEIWSHTRRWSGSSLSRFRHTHRHTTQRLFEYKDTFLVSVDAACESSSRRREGIRRFLCWEQWCHWPGILLTPRSPGSPWQLEAHQVKRDVSSPASTGGEIDASSGTGRLQTHCI